MVIAYLINSGGLLKFLESPYSHSLFQSKYDLQEQRFDRPKSTLGICEIRSRNCRIRNWKNAAFKQV